MGCSLAWHRRVSGATPAWALSHLTVSHGGQASGNASGIDHGSSARQVPHTYTALHLPQAANNLCNCSEHPSRQQPRPSYTHQTFSQGCLVPSPSLPTCTSVSPLKRARLPRSMTCVCALTTAHYVRYSTRTLLLSPPSARHAHSQTGPRLIILGVSLATRIATHDAHLELPGDFIGVHLPLTISTNFLKR